MVGLIRKHHKLSIRFTVGTMFIIATVVTSLFAIALQYWFTKQMSEEHVINKLDMATTGVSEYIQELNLNAKSSVRVLSRLSDIIDYQLSEEETRALLVQVLEDNPLFYSIYIGNDDEDFYQIINLASSQIVRQRIEASPQDRWVAIRITGPENNRIRQTLYYTDSFELTNVRTTSSNYFPTHRPWYSAKNTRNVYKTDPYLFKHLKITGQTYSMRSKNAVLGIDIVLSTISSKLTPSSLGLPENRGVEAFVFHQSGEVIASNQKLAPAQNRVAATRISLTDAEKRIISQTPPLLVSNQLDRRPYDYTRAGEPQGYSVELIKLLAGKIGLELEFINGFDSTTLLNKLRNDKLDMAHSLPGLSDEESKLLLFEEPLGIATLNTQKGSSTTAQGTKFGVLKEHAFDRQIKDLNPNASVMWFDDIEEAKQAIENGTINGLVDTKRALESFKRSVQLDATIQPFPSGTSVPFYLSLSPKYLDLLPIFKKSLNSVSTTELKSLEEAWYQQFDDNRIPYENLYELSHSEQLQGTIQRGTANGEKAFFYVSNLSVSGDRTKEFLAVVVPESVVMEQVYQRVYTTVGMTILVMCILVPVAWVFGSPIVNPIRSLTLQTQRIKQRDFDSVELVDSDIKEVWELSTSIQEMSQEIKLHEQQQQDFVDAFIKLIAQAIDDKSPYTAGHCNRVPELGMMLAKAAENTTSGKFKSFRFKNENERREFMTAAWLHDCGKITTPEHIVDKGTKLEANYNRIHEIRMRFEVLWRDAEITFLQSQLAKTMSKEDALLHLAETKKQLQEEFKFIASVNIGGEFIDDQKVVRIKEIGNRTWQRHFDDSLGLSPFEELNKAPVEQTLPVTEKLLSDKPEHIIKRIRPLVFDPSYGINVDVPEYQYNLGEIYNLSIGRGTLTPEDRFKINEHMISGIKMLEALPFPPELSRVPRYASTHHETLKGTGYPRKLSADDLSIPERILVIADIFEALTAADRPYKKAKPVSVAVDILHKMALDEHLDMDLFCLFLESGVYKEYADQFLPESQVDDVDISQYLPKQKVA